MSASEPNAPKRKLKRRWLQFSLRSLFVFVFLVAVLLGWLCYERKRTRDEEQAVEVIYARGGYVMYKHDPAIFHRADPPGPAWMKRLLGDYYLARLDLVKFPPGLDDKQLLPLSRLRGMERLGLGDSRLTDATLAHIVEFEGLVELDLTAADVSDAGVAKLRRMRRLKSLYLGFTPITDRAVEVLCEMPSLQLVDLTGTHVSKEGVQKLKTRMRRRYAEGTSRNGDASERGVPWMPVPSERERQIFAEVLRRRGGAGAIRREDVIGIEYFGSPDLSFGVTIFDTVECREVVPLLPHLTSLSALGVCATGLEDQEVEHLRRIPNLKWLDLGRPITTSQWRLLAGDDGEPARKADAADTATSKAGLTQRLERLMYRQAPITDADLEQIAKFTKLTWLNLSGTPITDAGLAHLKALTKLKFLSLGATPITNAGLAHLKALTELEILRLGGTRITDAGLVHLKALTKLKILELGGNKITPQGVEALRSALPDVEICDELPWR